MRVLLDTKVIISAVLFGGVPRRTIDAVLAGEIDLVTSPPLLAELESVLSRKFSFHSTMAATVRAEVEALSEVVEPGPIQQVTRNAADDQVLAAAIAGDAEIIVTGDKELLVLESYEGCAIEAPRAFIERLEKST